MADDSASNGTTTPGTLAPNALITSTDRRGLITVIAAILLSFVLTTFFTRLYIRLRVSGPWRKDDNAVMVATAFCVAHAALLFTAVKTGYGLTFEQVDPSSVSRMGKLAYSSDLIYLLTMMLSKCATAMLFLRLSPSQNHMYAAWSIFALSVVWAVAALLAVTIGCDSRAWVDSAVHCSGELTRWRVVAAFDVVTELVLFIMSIFLVWGLQMGTKIKVTVIAAFSVRLPVIAAALVRLRAKQTEVGASDLTLAAATTSAWTIIELSYAVISCTLLCLGPFIQPFEKVYRAKYYSRQSPYKLSALSRATDDSQNQRSGHHHHHDEGSLTPHGLRPDEFNYRTDVTANGARIRQTDRASLGSTDSKKMIISKQVEWTTTVQNHDEISEMERSSNAAKSAEGL